MAIDHGSEIRSEMTSEISIDRSMENVLPIHGIITRLLWCAGCPWELQCPARFVLVRPKERMLGMLWLVWLHQCRVDWREISFHGCLLVVLWLFYGYLMVFNGGFNGNIWEKSMSFQVIWITHIGFHCDFMVASMGIWWKYDGNSDWLVVWNMTFTFPFSWE